MTRLRVIVGAAILAGALLSAAIHGWLGDRGGRDKTDATESRGPHGGRLLVAEDLALEVVTSGERRSAQFRMYPFTLDRRPIPPTEVQLRATLERSGSLTERITFVPEGDFFKSTSVIAEPHWFIVRMTVTYRGLSHSFRYEQLETNQ